MSCSLVFITRCVAFDSSRDVHYWELRPASNALHVENGYSAAARLQIKLPECNAFSGNFLFVTYDIISEGISL